MHTQQEKPDYTKWRQMYCADADPDVNGVPNEVPVTMNKM